MYVPFDRFEELTLGDGDITEEFYAKAAPMADAIIDHWTLDRVGRAVRNDEELPEIVEALYVKIVESLPAVMDGVKMGKGGLVSSFSNGIDSYTFDVSDTVEKRLKDTIGWMVGMLPVEWISECVSFEGGNRYAG